jgi:hypothetical protein
MSCESELHLGDTNFVFFVTVTEDCAAIDISAATSKVITFLKPSGEYVAKTATFTSDGTDGKIQYATVSGDIDEVGLWKIQAIVELGSGSLYHSSVKSFKVMHNISI